MKGKLPTRILGKTGYSISTIGIGGCGIGHVYNEHDAPTSDESFEMVKYGLDKGINIIDTAPLYGVGKSETELGKILSRLNNENIHKRDSYYLCTKIGRYGFGADDMDYGVKATKDSIQKSLNKLQTDYIDILHIHDFELSPKGLDQIINETLPYLYELKNETNSPIHNIGLSGQQLVVMDYVAKKFGYDKIDTFLTYNNYNIPDVKLLNYMDRLNKYEIGIIQGGSSYQGLLTCKGPQSWFPHQKEFLECGKIANEEVTMISRQYYGGQYDQDAISRLAFLFTHSYNDIHTVLVGTNTLNEMKRNIDYLLDGNYNIDDNECDLNENDKMMVKYLQSDIFADIMNVGTIERAAKDNVIQAHLDTVH